MSIEKIHPTAIIETGAKIAPDVEIGPFCVIGPHVTLGAGVKIKSHVVIEGHTDIGENCTIYPFASLGCTPQDLKYAGEDSRLIIGKNNTIREYVTMNPGTKDGGMETRVGDNGLFMVSVHIAHDCRIGNNVIMANNATLAGHVHVGDFAIIGGLSAAHQFIRIGEHAIIGGMSGVENDVIPFGRVKGERAFLAGLNLIGLERRGFGKDDIRKLQRAFNQLFGDEGTMEQRLESVAQDFADDETIVKIVEFAKAKTKFTLCQPAKKNP
ncbi:MAG: acyl-ACP--UDP-N-acetylglucosamine O-acyltransferase [Alphaproteobacteria bacterium]|nr:acyl-ACP--UDP-N-acetylglucosamine O-acyltransferase [Alphaproteobacteria bacterium]